MSKKNASEESSEQSLLEHIDELMRRLRRIVLWILLGAVVGYVALPYVTEYLFVPLENLGELKPKIGFFRPFEKMWAMLRLSLYVGGFLVFPFILYEVMAFVGPAFHKKEKKQILPFLLFSLPAFLGGCVCGYFLVLPLILKTVLGFGGNLQIEAFLGLASYLSGFAGILIFSALLFELPVVMVFLTRWGWVKVEVWKRQRRLAFVINSILSAFFSPPDPLSMILMIIPLQVLYEAGIFFANMAQYRSNGEK